MKTSKGIMHHLREVKPEAVGESPSWLDVHLERLFDGPVDASRAMFVQPDGSLGPKPHGKCKEALRKLAGLAVLALVGLVAGGCMLSTPAIGGKTKLALNFMDTTEEQQTVFEVKASAPAGVDMDQVAAMFYEWKNDGSGELSVNSSAALDSTVQAELLARVAELTTEQRMQLAGKLGDMLTPLMTALGVKISTPKPPPGPPGPMDPEVEAVLGLASSLLMPVTP